MAVSEGTFIHVFGYYSFMSMSGRKDTHSLTHPFGGLAMKKQNGSTKDLTKGKRRLEVHRHLLITH